MLFQQLHTAGFFPISWSPSEGATPGTTYVRPTALGVLRVFVPEGSSEMELYTGRLASGRLCYRGPVPSQDGLQELLNRTLHGNKHNF
jgi:hypothetical protein